MKLKILVATHKPCMIPADEDYQLIHCGRALSNLSPEVLNWMKVNTIGDDTGENISTLNPYYCELTAIYWAWKNYEKIGDPESIGFCHYRRYFMDIGSEDEITVPVLSLKRSIREQFNRVHDSNELSRAVAFLPLELRQSVEEYLNLKKGYFYNMFVLKKSLFFEYCDVLFEALFKASQASNWESYSTYQKRMGGFLAERLTGGFIYYLNKVKNIPIHETLPVVPISSNSSMVKTQANLTKWLNRNIPGFSNIYANILKMQIQNAQHKKPFYGNSRCAPPTSTSQS